MKKVGFLNEIAFALENRGVHFVTIENFESTFKVLENKDEVYFSDKEVDCIAIANENILLVSVFGDSNVQVVDRSKKQVISHLNNNSLNGGYNCFV